VVYRSMMLPLNDQWCRLSTKTQYQPKKVPQINKKNFFIKQPLITMSYYYLRQHISRQETLCSPGRILGTWHLKKGFKSIGYSNMAANIGRPLIKSMSGHLLNHRQLFHAWHQVFQPSSANIYFDCEPIASCLSAQGKSIFNIISFFPVNSYYS
jgi:hypothetical protein